MICRFPEFLNLGLSGEVFLRSESKRSRRYNYDKAIFASAMVNDWKYGMVFLDNEIIAQYDGMLFGFEI